MAGLCEMANKHPAADVSDIVTAKSRERGDM